MGYSLLNKNSKIKNFMYHKYLVNGSFGLTLEHVTSGSGHVKVNMIRFDFSFQLGDFWFGLISGQLFLVQLILEEKT